MGAATMARSLTATPARRLASSAAITSAPPAGTGVALAPELLQDAKASPADPAPAKARNRRREYDGADISLSIA